MKCPNTVMTIDRELELRNKWCKSDEGSHISWRNYWLQDQAEISFRLGIKEVVRKIREAIAIEYKNAIEETKANPFQVKNLDYEHHLIWKGHANAYCETISYLDTLA